MASKIIMSCMVPIFTQVTLKVMLYMLHNHAQIKLFNEPHDDVTDNVFQDDKNYKKSPIRGLTDCLCLFHVYCLQGLQEVRLVGQGNRHASRLVLELRFYVKYYSTSSF